MYSSLEAPSPAAAQNVEKANHQIMGPALFPGTPVPTRNSMQVCSGYIQNSLILQLKDT